MKRFKEQIIENPTLDAIGHDMPMSPKRKNQLESDRGVFKDFPSSHWLDYTPFPNSSEQTKRELKQLQSYEQYRQGKKLEFMDMVDTKVMKPYRDYFKKHGLDTKLLDEVKELKNNIQPIVLQLKVHYNRPRPSKLANALQFMFQTNFTVHALKTAETPAYPSGHATEGRFISLFLADRIPFQHKADIQKIGEDIGMSRQIGGVHYPSDTEFGHQLANALYSHYKGKKGQKKESVLFQNLIAEEAFNIPLETPEDIDSFPTKLDKNELKKILKYVKSQTEVVPLAGGNEGGIKVRLKDAETKQWVKDNTNVKVSFGSGSIGKEPSPSGEDWEAMITVAQRTRKGKDPSKETPNEWERVSTKGLWSGSLVKQAEKLADTFDKNGLPNLTQTGSGKGGGSISKEWSKWGGKNATPKTDIMSGKKRVSLKKVGGSQVMSAKKEEGIATFNAASMTMGKDAPNDAKKIVDFMQKSTLDLSGSGYRGTVTDLENDLENANPSQMKKLKPFQDELKTVRKNGAVLTKQMVSLFNSNPTFKKHFVFEAATGQVKFGDKSISRADTMVEFDDKKGKINHNYSLKTVNEGDVQKLSNLYKFYASFKSSGSSSPYMSIRGNIEATPQKVLNFTKKILAKEEMMTFSGIMNEALTMNEQGRKVLHENTIEQLDEFALLDKIKKGVSNIDKKIRDKFIQMWNWIKEKLNMAFEWIKKQGEKMISMLMKFFGIQVTTAGLRGGVELFTE